MAVAYIGNTGHKMAVGNVRIKRAYLGNTMVLSDEVSVIYHIDDSIGLVYPERTNVGGDCLSPKSFNPIGMKPEYVFLGWRLDSEPSSTVLSTLTAGVDTIELYAVYYRAYEVNFYNASTTKTTKTYVMYYNNGNRIHPKTSVADTTLNPVASYKNPIGWTDVLNSFTRKYANASVIEIKADMDLYSIYEQNSTIFVINGSEDGPIKTTVTGTRRRQYNPNAIYTINPSTTLTHNEISGWENAGWNIVGNSSEKTIDDGLFNITEQYDGKSIYALYNKATEMYLINGSDTGGIKSTVKGYRYIQFASVKNTINPVVQLLHNQLYKKNSNGWTFGTDNTAPITQDGAFSILPQYDNRTLFALYNYTVNINWWTNPRAGASLTQATRYLRAVNNSWSVTHPIVSRAINPKDGWYTVGWSSNPNCTRGAEYPAGYQFTLVGNSDTVNLYSIYTQDIKLDVTINESVQRYYGAVYWNSGTDPSKYSDKNYPKFTVESPEPVVEDEVIRRFQGWSIDSESTEIAYPEINNTEFREETQLYAVWKYDDKVIDSDKNYTDFGVPYIEEAIYIKKFYKKYYDKVFLDVTPSYFESMENISIPSGKLATIIFSYHAENSSGTSVFKTICYKSFVRNTRTVVEEKGVGERFTQIIDYSLDYFDLWLLYRGPVINDYHYRIKYTIHELKFIGKLIVK